MQYSIIFLSSLFGFFLSPSFTKAECEEHPLSTAADKRSWSYIDSQQGQGGVCSESHKCGPSHWADIVPTGTTVNMCGGSAQTPIDIREAYTRVDKTLAYPKFRVDNGGCKSWTSFADDHAVELSFSEPDDICANLGVSVSGVDYTLAQFHMHSPSEHKVNGRYAAAEIHFVHKSAEGKLLVVGVLLDVDKKLKGSNNILQKLWKIIQQHEPNTNLKDPHEVGHAIHCEAKSETPNGLNPYALLPFSKDYYSYDGSLTTYPCSEGVKWIVMKEHIKASEFDIDVFRTAVMAYSKSITTRTGQDARPVQPLNGRVVSAYQSPVKPSAPKPKPAKKPIKKMSHKKHQRKTHHKKRMSKKV
eukprot:gene8987-18597_t